MKRDTNEIFTLLLRAEIFYNICRYAVCSLRCIECCQVHTKGKIRGKVATNMFVNSHCLMAGSFSIVKFRRIKANRNDFRQKKLKKIRMKR